MGKSSPPPPPDPKDTASAQTGTNIGTAIANSMLGMVDQYTPYGNLTYEQVGGSPIGGTGGASTLPGIETIESGGMRQPETSYRVGDQTFGSLGEAESYQSQFGSSGGPGGTGSYFYNDPFTGETYEIPRFKSTIELNPQQQETLDFSQQAQTDLAGLAADRADFLRSYLPDTEGITDQIDSKLYELGAARLDPRFERESDALRTRLINQGINPGSEAYNREMDQFLQSKNDAYNQLLLQGRGQALAEVNQPINQITALLSGSQVQNPAVQMQSPASIPTTDVAGIINNNYQQQLAGYNQQQAQKNSMLGGLFGAGATLLGAPSGSVFGSWMT